MIFTQFRVEFDICVVWPMVQGLRSLVSVGIVHHVVCVE